MNDAHLPYLAVQPQVNTLQLIPIDDPALPHRRVPFRSPIFFPPPLSFLPTQHKKSTNTAPYCQYVFGWNRVFGLCVLLTNNVDAEERADGS